MSAVVLDLAAARARRSGVAAPSSTTSAAAALAAGKRLLKPDELAAKLGVSTRTIRRDRQAGMPCVPVTEQLTRYVLEDCLEWQRRRRGHVDTPPAEAS